MLDGCPACEALQRDPEWQRQMAETAELRGDEKPGGVDEIRRLLGVNDEGIKRMDAKGDG